MKKHLDVIRHTGSLLRIYTLPVLLATALLSGCGAGGEDKTSGSTAVVPLRLNSPADITSVSDADYNLNTSGLITGTTLKSWMSDWIANRPTGITGKLVIFQVTAGEAGYEYFKPNSTTVFSYLAASSEWVMTRSNGVISSPSIVLDGPSMDAQLKKYNIDPLKDMIVVAQGTASSSNVMSQGRAWLAFRYWGVEAKHLAILNGGNKWQVDNGEMLAGDFQATALTGPNTGIHSVKELPVDNTSLLATLGDMLSVVPATDINDKTDGVFIWDARTITQYSAGVKRELNDTGSGCGTAAYCDAASSYNYMSSFQNSGSRQGHPYGAIDLNFINLLDATKGYSFKPKAELESYMNGETDASGFGMVDASYNLVGAGNAYQPGDTVYVYCETTFRAMITGMASSVILGHPTRFYDGAMVEWNSMSYIQDQTGNYILPANSPWRTDTHSYFTAADSMTKVAPRDIVDPFASNANAAIAADRAYKTQSASSGGAAGGVAPANPCGG